MDDKINSTKPAPTSGPLSDTLADQKVWDMNQGAKTGKGK